MMVISDIFGSTSRHNDVTSSKYVITDSSCRCFRCDNLSSFVLMMFVEKYRLRNAVSNSDHFVNCDSLSSNHAPAFCVSFPRTISSNSGSVELLSAFEMFFMLFRNRSGSSDNCPEKLGESS